MNHKFVYFLISWDSLFVKIGYCTNVKQRMANIQNGCPYLLDFSIGYKTDKHKELERTFHNLFSDFHHRGEWFLFSDRAIEIAQTIRQKIGGRIILTDEVESKIMDYKNALL